jgi:hypothetical protein
MKTSVGLDVLIHTFLTSTLGGSEWQDSCPEGKRRRYLQDMRLGGPRGQWVRCGEDKNAFPRWESQPVPYLLSSSAVKNEAMSCCV